MRVLLKEIIGVLDWVWIYITVMDQLLDLSTFDLLRRDFKTI